MLENHVPSLELCKKWKELGGRQDTIFTWELFDAEYFGTEKDVWSVQFTGSILQGNEHIIAAPLASEMMEWERNNINYIWPTEDFWNWCDNTEKSDYDPSLPNALMQMCMARKEEENGKGY